MSCIVANSFKRLGARALSRSNAIKTKQAPFRRSFTSSATRRYAHCSTNGLGNFRASFSFNWLPFTSIPAIGAGFWASSKSDNTIEKTNEDIEKMAMMLDNPDQETTSLAIQVIQKILNLPDKEIHRDLIYLLAAVSSAAKAIAQVNPYAPEADQAVQLSYEFAKRLNNDSKTSGELRLDSVRCAHKAEYFVYMYRQDYENMKVVLEKDVDAIQGWNKKNGISVMTPDESQAIWMLAAVMGNLDDPNTKGMLEKSISIFKGVTTETLTPDLERVWIERLVSSLSHGFVLEIGDHPASSKEFKRIALALYEQYSRVAPDSSTIPLYKDLETKLKTSALASGPP